MQGLVIAEYVWVGGGGSAYDLRSKARTLSGTFDAVESLPTWSFDGSSCDQASANSSDVTLVPVAMFGDPFRGAPHILVLCECVEAQGTPLKSNKRHFAKRIMELVEARDIWIGFEQEYILLKDERPLGWPAQGGPGLGRNYCGVGGRINGREVVDEHYRLCLEAGIHLFGVNIEVLPGQFEFQTGPSPPVVAADHLVIARYILQRVAEKHRLHVSFEPKPFPALPGSGLHTNYSDDLIRNRNQEALESALNNLAGAHPRTLGLYGDNSRRLSGLHETSRADTFTHGYSDRTASVRIPPSLGYIEDRRPASDACPYLVTSALVDAVYLQSSCIHLIPM